MLGRRSVLSVFQFDQHLIHLIHQTVLRSAHPKTNEVVISPHVRSSNWRTAWAPAFARLILDS